MVCVPGNRADMAGVCLKEGVGHSMWEKCDPPLGRPSYCPENSLYFVRCRKIEVQSGAMSSDKPQRTTDDEPSEKMREFFEERGLG